MKKHILSAASIAFMTTTANAGDLSSRKEPITSPPPAPIWTGFYAGLNAGGTWANGNSLKSTTYNTYVYPNGDNPHSNQVASDLETSSGAGLSNNLGFIGGGQIGYNLQVMDKFVIGAEADIQGIAGGGSALNNWSAANSVDYYVAGNPNGYNIISNQIGSSNVSYIGTVRGRIGFLALPTVLAYGTAGLAYGEVNGSIQNTETWKGFGDADPDIGSLGYDYLEYGSGSQSRTKVGWTAGGGFEWMLSSNWSIKAEYLYYDLGDISGSVVNRYVGTGPNSNLPGYSGIQNITKYNASINGNIVRAGVNYHFNYASAPVVAMF